MRSLALGALAALLIGGCAPGNRRDDDSRIVVPEVPGAAAAAAALPASPSGSLPALIAPLDRSDRPLAVVNANLDADPQDEQVVAVQRRDDPTAPVRLLVLDPEYPRGRGARICWEAPTLAESARAFVLSVKDLVGDHGAQLVATGTNGEGRLTLNVFRRAAADDLLFVSVCEVVADEISIEESSRSEAYSSGLKNGASWPVIAWMRDPESENPTDLVRIRWTWRPALERYAPEPPEKVPGETVGQEQVRQLYADLRPEAFEAFLAGLWTETPAPARGAPTIVQFDPAARRIAINDGDTLESFFWRDTVRTLFDRIMVVAENEAVPTMRVTLFVRAAGASSISVSLRGDNEWDARDFDLARLSDRSPARRPSTVVRPAGEFIGPRGLQVRFDADRIEWIDGPVRRSGTWAAFALGGRSIVTVRFLDGGRETRSWVVLMKETRDKSSLTRSLSLSPVSLTVEGWEESAGDALELIQTQKLVKP